MRTGEAFSPREEEVIAYAASGLLDKEIAIKMGISIHTLHTYWKRIRQKMGPLSRSGIIHEWSKAQESQPDLGDWHPFTRWILDFREPTFRLFNVSGDGTDPLDFMEESAFMHPADMRTWARHFDDLLQGRVAVDAHTFRAINGRQIFQVHSLATALRNEAGAIQAVLGYWVKTPFPRPLNCEVPGGIWMLSRSFGLFHAAEGASRLFNLDPSSDGRNAQAFIDKLSDASLANLRMAYADLLSRNGGVFSRVESLKPDMGSRELLIQAAVELLPEGTLAVGQVVDLASLDQGGLPFP